MTSERRLTVPLQQSGPTPTRSLRFRKRLCLGGLAHSLSPSVSSNVHLEVTRGEDGNGALLADHAATCGSALLPANSYPLARVAARRKD